MKKLFLLGLLTLLAGPAAAQHTELLGRAGLGLLHFGGRDAAATSHVNYYRENGREGGHTNNPYGQQAGLGFSLGVRVQRVGRRQGLLAFDFGYDQVRSRTDVDVVDFYDGQSNTARPATGTDYLHQKSLTALLAVGRRFALSPVTTIDVLASQEAEYVFDLQERGEGTFDGSTAWSTRTERSFSSSPINMRLRADITLWYQRVGLTASYSHGFSNYLAGLLGGTTPEVYAHTLRLGGVYRLR